MKKKLVALFLSLFTLFGGMGLFACGEKDDTIVSVSGDLTFELSNKKGYCSVVDCNEEAVSVTIPATYEQLPVREIAFVAFEECKNLQEVGIPDSVHTIGESAFRGCSSLQEVGIPDSVHTIKGGAFSGCSSLDEVFIPGSVNLIGSAAFSGCTNLTSVYIGGGVTSIGDRAFAGCINLLSLDLPDSILSIGEYTFQRCEKMTSLTLGAGVASIGENAFWFCDELTDIFVSEKNPNYASQDGILYNKTKTKFVHIPTAWQGELVILDSVTVIEAYEVVHCRKLTSIIVHAGVVSIGKGAFCDNWSLESIIVAEDNPFYKSIDGNLYSKDGKTLIRHARESVDTMSAPIMRFIIPDGVTEIGAYAFAYHSMRQIVIPLSVKSIGEWAFFGVYNIDCVYYLGGEEDWNKISIDNTDNRNADFLSTRRYYYSESEPTKSGDYWRYVDGVPTPW